MFDEQTRKEWPDSPTWVIQGKLEDHIVVSVPFTASIETMNRISEQIEREFKRPACVVNHCMEFLVATRLRSSEAAEVLKRIDDYAEARREAFRQAVAEDEFDPNGSDPNGGAQTAGMGDQ